ncbi:MAG TPA: CoA pyrophosphatase, partial [Actinomycetota bacterium]|nr:CoA pyrophosphatase [Actinomycetota bacterium]
MPPTAPIPAGRGGDQKIPRPYSARPGGPPPWVDLPPDRRCPTVADVRAALADLGPARPSQRALLDGAPRPGRPSAVLAPIYDDAVEIGGVLTVGAHVVLTRRTWGLRTHRGEVSFPGGRVDDGESPVDGARREAEEEIALDGTHVEIIGELDHLATVTSRSFIVPYVGALPEGRPETVANPAEVSAVLHVPVSELLDPAIYR